MCYARYANPSDTPKRITLKVRETDHEAFSRLARQGMYISPFVFTMAPIILGASEDAAWTLPWVAMSQVPDVFLKLIGMLVITTFILTFTPVLNLFTSLHTLVLGSLTLLYVFKLIAPISLGGELVDYIPDFWFSVGLLAVGSILSWMGIVVTAFFLTVVGKVEESFSALAIPFLGSVFGFIPVFMYGAWLGAQVRGGF